MKLEHLMIIGIIIGVSFWGAMGYIAWHFIAKFW
jgi:hypothetical protein